MISVIVYGRNDSYGYNLQKRAALSLNCIAELLTDPNDEIVFLDCNSPDDFPTFPESIHDELTDRTKCLMRIIRLRPATYAQHSRGTKLPVVEPLCRNVAIRRTNPVNRWILSTNTDMIFLMRDGKRSFSDICAGLADGFYELPRFEIPEAFWETLDRKNPSVAMETVRRWSRTLHLNEAVELNPFMRYDGPGDFQLILRKQLFDIHGFNEEMIWGWHVDANICKRLYLLNGRTETLLDKMYGYHCQHTLQLSILHSDKKTENDPEKYFYRVKTPYLEMQSDTWGIPGKDIEDIRLDSGRDKEFVDIVESLLPPALTEVTFDRLSHNFNRQKYHINHAFPFLVNQLRHLPENSTIGYIGADHRMVSQLAAFITAFSSRMKLLVCMPDYMDHENYHEDLCVTITTIDTLMLKADQYIFDVCILNDRRKIHLFPHMYSFDYLIDESLRDNIREIFIQCCMNEHRQLSTGAEPKKFILVGSADTWMAGIAAEFLGVALSGYTTRVRYGRLKPLLASATFLDNSHRAAPIHSGQNLDDNSLDLLHFIIAHIHKEETVVAPFDIHAFIPARIFTYAQTFFGIDIEPDWVIVNRLKLKNIDRIFLVKARSELRTVYVNKIFMVLTRRVDVNRLPLSFYRILFAMFFSVLQITSLKKVGNLLKAFGKRKFETDKETETK